MFANKIFFGIQKAKVFFINFVYFYQSFYLDMLSMHLCQYSGNSSMSYLRSYLGVLKSTGVIKFFKGTVLLLGYRIFSCQEVGPHFRKSRSLSAQRLISMVDDVIW